MISLLRSSIFNIYMFVATQKIMKSGIYKKIYNKPWLFEGLNQLWIAISHSAWAQLMLHLSLFELYSNTALYGQWNMLYNGQSLCHIELT